VFRIKICGVTTIEDARLVARSGADAIGLNFYAPSPRHLPLERATHVAEEIPDSVAKVGVFVNADEENICDLYDRLSLDYVQLHGDETPEYLARLEHRPVIRAFRVGAGGLAPVYEYLDHCHEMGCTPAAILVDAYDRHAHGGTGKVVDWSVAAEYMAAEDHASRPPMILAGGLGPDNVAEAIHAVRPDGVDVASGVESSPGVKHTARLSSFIQAARSALG
jgi:phosphoribosylanthranilate isomerase